MKLVSVSIQNFRCYRDRTTVPIGALTAFVGKNDIGKSTLLESLEIFFNNETVCIEAGDANINSGEGHVMIECEFDDLPAHLTLDAGAATTLADEFLLSDAGTLKIKKIFNCSNKKPSAEVFIVAKHPSGTGVANLLELKEKELQAIIRERGLKVSLKGNPGMRRAIWEAAKEQLNVTETDIPVSKAKEDGKRLWEQIESHLPMFALFQSDRSSKDSDQEVQNPMKAAIAAAIAEVQDDVERIQKRVREKAEAIALSTHEELKLLDSRLASELSPTFTPPTPAKWNGLFSVGLNTDSGIPLNKRGSGVRRLVLVSFFKAEAKRRQKTNAKRSIIYAIEEPETSQHPNNQRFLLESFRSLSCEAGCQVLLTTHSPGLAAELPVESVRFVSRDSHGRPVIRCGASVFPEVATALGVIPDSRVKVLLCVEGPTDVKALKALSHALHAADSSVIDLDNDERVAFVVLGGGNLKHWVNEQYLRALGRPEVHIYDADVSAYQESVETVNRRTDGSWAVFTSKHEIESYLHKDAINAAFGVEVEVTDVPVRNKAVPRVFAEAYSLLKGYDGVLSDNKAKILLADGAFPLMNADMIHERDGAGEISGWLRRIKQMF
jgi:putative ATP-dependent endonuclease of the OLD family